MKKYPEPFNPYIFDYKTYIKETHHLDEMPSRHDLFGNRYDDFVMNMKDGVEIEKEKTTKFVEIYREETLRYRVYYEKLNDSNIYYLLHLNDTFIVMLYSFIRIDKPMKGIENKEIWNHIKYKGIARSFLVNYILQKEPVMISDRTLSSHGYRMWQRLFEDCVILNKTHKMNVININDGNILKNIKNEDEMDEFFGNNLLEIRFVLEKL